MSTRRGVRYSAGGGHHLTWYDDMAACPRAAHVAVAVVWEVT